MSHPWSSPAATVLTRSSGVPERLGWTVGVAEAVPAPPGAAGGAAGALHAGDEESGERREYRSDSSRHRVIVTTTG